MVTSFIRMAAKAGRLWWAGLFLLCLAAAVAGGMGTARADIVMTDAAGREVRLTAPARRIVTNESLLLLSLGLIDPDPVARLAGWAAPRRFDAGMYESFRRKFPQIDDVPIVGSVTPANASAEAVLGAGPDLFVVSIWDQGWDSTVERLAAAGVPTLFLDGPANASRGPGEATAFSMRLLGQAIGREAEASGFAEFVLSRYAHVVERLGQVTDRPDVLVDAHAGVSCCATPGADNRLTQLVELAGGHSIGAGLVPGYDGQLSLEYVLETDPRVYVATGGPHLARQGGLVVGGGISDKAARESLRGAVGRNHLDSLTAVREGRAYGISHQLSISAISVLMLECLAKWLHPDLFADLDPADTLAQINRNFMAVPLEGTFWVGLEDGADGQLQGKEPGR